MLKCMFSEQCELKPISVTKEKYTDYDVNKGTLKVQN